VVTVPGVVTVLIPQQAEKARRFEKMELAEVQVLLIDRLKDKEAECVRAHEANAALRAANDSLAAENRALRDAVVRQREGERSVAAQQAQLSVDMAALVARLEEVSAVKRELETVKNRFEVQTVAHSIPPTFYTHTHTAHGCRALSKAGGASRCMPVCSLFSRPPACPPDARRCLALFGQNSIQYPMFDAHVHRNSNSGRR
jgi:hypothetical protein